MSFLQSVFHSLLNPALALHPDIARLGALQLGAPSSCVAPKLGTLSNECSSCLRRRRSEQKLHHPGGSTSDGDERASLFPLALAKSFLAEEWAVVEHLSNTTTGFSGTLFRNNQTGELVLSFRSTEFLDDAARDNQATNAMEIRDFGGAFGQIADMEQWLTDGLRGC